METAEQIHQGIKDELLEKGVVYPDMLWESHGHLVMYLNKICEELDCELAIDPGELYEDLCELGVIPNIVYLKLEEGVLYPGIS